MTSLTARPLPAVLRAEPPPPPGGAAAWAAAHRQALRAAVLDHGSLLVRGLALADPAEVAAVFRIVGDGDGDGDGELMTERETFAARRAYADSAGASTGVYGATPWPPQQQMCMHHELSHRLEFAGLMLFACLTAPSSGGATPLADAHAVLDALPAELVARFEREGWLLTRTFGADVGTSVAEAFGTDDRAAVERYCRAHRIAFEWRPDGGLRTRQRRAAVVRHPVSGLRCWFNQVAFLSEWTMDPEVRDYLLDVYGAEALPFATAYGDGEPVGADVVELLNAAYDAHTVREPWQPGDLLLIDNIRTAHGREPYEGAREVLAALAAPVRAEDLR